MNTDADDKKQITLENLIEQIKSMPELPKPVVDHLTREEAVKSIRDTVEKLIVLCDEGDLAVRDFMIYFILNATFLIKTAKKNTGDPGKPCSDCGKTH